jgi:Zn-dependent protease
MRDPMSWAVPLFRLSGVQVKVHVLFIIVTLGFFFRQLFQKGNPIGWPELLAFTVVIPFLVILWHEFGHCVGAWRVGGEAKEILMWPLGGLAYVDVPHTPRANFIATAAGPAVNVIICAACAVGLAFGGFLPNANPLASPYVSEIKNYEDGRVYTSAYGLKLYKKDTAEPMAGFQDLIDAQMKSGGGLQDRVVIHPDEAAALAKFAAASGHDRALAPGWAVWLNRTFYVSWILLLFNLIPAYPLDGGRMFQTAVWARTDYRRGVTVAAYTGFGVAVVFLIVSIAGNEAIFMGLALFMLYESSMALHRLENDDGPFGYDFSGGYTTLEKDDDPRPRPKRVGWFTRWRQARRARKIQREATERALEEERMDQLLEKIARTGKESLTDEEKRFLERVSARKRNMSETSTV